MKAISFFTRSLPSHVPSALAFGGRMKTCSAVTAIVLIALSSCATLAAEKLVLITEAEATLPSVSKGDTRATRCHARPESCAGAAREQDSGQRSPLHLLFKFESFGGAKIDPQDVKVVYLKKPVVDLSDRVKPYILGRRHRHRACGDATPATRQSASTLRIQTAVHPPRCSRFTSCRSS